MELDYVVIRALTEAPTISDALRDVLEALSSHLGCDFGGVWQIDQNTGRLRCFTTWESPDADVEAFRAATRERELEVGEGLPGRVWESRKPSWITDVLADESFARAAAASACGLHGALAFPVLGPAGPEAVLEFFTRERAHLDDRLLETVAKVGPQTGQYLARMRAEARAHWLAAVVDSSEDAIVAATLAGEIVSWNLGAEKLYGWRGREIIGRPLQLLVPEGHAEETELLQQRVREGEAIENHETVRKRKDGSLIDVSLSLSPVRDSNGNVIGTARIARDITQRKRVDAQREQLLKELDFLSEASRVLEESLDLDETLRIVADLTIPFLGDGCMVDLREESGAIKRVAIAAADPAMRPILERLRQHKIDPESSHPIAVAMRTGRIQVVDEVTDELRESWAADDAYLDDVRSWPGRAAVVAPMIARGKTLGTIALASFSDRKFNAEDIATIKELARRAAISVDNSRLFGERSHIAERLQRSLLPPILPDIPGLEVAARFRASTGYDVGGDFYDVFETAAGNWALVIGDVAGRGADAAATTALARYTIRTAAMRERQPERVLQILNEAILKENLQSRFCTVVYAQFSIDNGSAKVQVASAGHPLPLLLRASGSIESVGRSGTLLGILPEIELPIGERDLGLGDTLLFYTDGVIEARAEEGMLGEEGLTAALATCAGLDAGRMTERLDSRLLSAQVRDDAAILVARVIEGVPAQADSLLAAPAPQA